MTPKPPSAVDVVRLIGEAMTEVETLTPERMLELAQLHDRLERENSLDDLMETISDDPYWEIYPLGMRIDGRDAVREYYPFTIQGIIPRIASSTRRVTAYGDRTIFRESTYRIRQPDGQEADAQAVIVFEFEDDGSCISERVYASGAMVQLLEETLITLWSKPGFSRIGT
jgi:hypothetical protein